MVTIHDVAKRANVSIATVSYALNGKNSVSEKTRRRIKEIADELGYVPNSLAQGLLTKSTRVIGVIMPDISHHFISTFIKYLQHHARLRDYFLLIGSNYSEFNSAREIIEQFIAKKVDALIVTPETLLCEGEAAYRSVVRQIADSNTPLLMFNEVMAGYDDNFICPDVEQGQYLLTRHVLERGHTFPVFIGGSSAHTNTVLRQRGFRRALEEAGLEMKDWQIAEGAYEFHDGYEKAAAWLKQYGQPDAFLAVNDVYALGVYKALKEAGLAVPHQVSLAGYDDLQLPTLEELPLTTVKIPLQEMSRLSVEALIRMKENPKERFQILLPPELIERGSVEQRC